MAATERRYKKELSVAIGTLVREYIGELLDAIDTPGFFLERPE